MLRADRLRATLAAAVVIATLLAAPQAGAQESLTNDIGMGIASGVCTLIYTPFKILYAAGGTLVGGLVYIWSVGDIESAQRVLRITAGGDYVVSPEHLRGLRVLQVSGS